MSYQVVASRVTPMIVAARLVFVRAVYRCTNSHNNERRMRQPITHPLYKISSEKKI